MERQGTVYVRASLSMAFFDLRYLPAFSNTTISDFLTINSLQISQYLNNLILFLH